MNKDEQKYMSPRTITRRYNISTSTLRLWSDTGKIGCIRPFGRKRLYNADDIRRVFMQKNSNIVERKRILYARVSSPHQKEDLERQIQYLQSKYPEDELIQDIGSGLNWKRKGLETILERVYNGDVSEIVVSYKDRLCRFGFELFEWICKKSNVKILVVNPVSETEDREKELSEDLLSIITVFVAKNNGNKAANYRKQRLQQQCPSTSSESQKNQNVSKQGTENKT